MLSTLCPFISKPLENRILKTETFKIKTDETEIIKVITFDIKLFK